MAMTTPTSDTSAASRPRKLLLLLLAIPLVFLMAPIALMLIASPVVAVWVGLYSLLGLALPDEIDSLIPLGPLGDVFGGLLGPLLNALVLGATIVIATSQGRHARAELKAATDRFQTEQKQNADDAKFGRANGVVAWIAETQRDRAGKSHLGVIVTNSSGSLVRNLDIVVTLKSPSLANELELRNRETVVPPGSWFLQLDRERAERDEAAENVDGGWPAPVPVDASGHFRVTLPAGDNGGGDDGVYTLRVHPPEQDEDGSPLPYYEVHEMQFELAGEGWKRDKNGTLSLKEREEEWNRRFAAFAAAPKPPVQGPKQVHHKNPIVQERIRRLAAVMAGRQADEMLQNRRYPLSEPFKRAGLTELRVTTGGQAISFYSDPGQANNKGVIWFAGRGADEVIPTTLVFTGAWASGTPATSLNPLRKELQPYSEQPEELARVLVERIDGYRKVTEARFTG
ncbi:hypothetical protein [Microbacterium phyllosphaerae]|uniref:hypothetical protein n=1 Tax=Microbacterium phyllosphaerae TaxID=124798 RepID=UPI003D64F773